MEDFDKLMRRYHAHFRLALQNMQSPIKFHRGSVKASTHMVYLRKLRKYLTENLYRLPSDLPSDTFLEWAKTATFWEEDGMVFMGKRPTDADRVADATDTTSPKYAGIIDHPLTVNDLQAIFYVMQNNLVTLPIKIKNPLPEIKDAAQQFDAKCSNTSLIFNIDHMIIL